MKYERKSFSVSPGAANISQENWERTFGKKPTAAAPAVVHQSGRADLALCGAPMDLHPGQAVTCPACQRLLMDMSGPNQKQTVAISGVWLRTRDQTRPSEVYQRAKVLETIFEVLVEIDGEWRLIQAHGVRPIEQTISHITEPAGLEKAPKDLL